MFPRSIARRLAALPAAALLALSLAACGATAAPEPTTTPAPALVATATLPALPEATPTDASAALEATAAGAAAALEATANSMLAAVPTTQPTAAEAGDAMGACAALSAADVEKVLGKLDAAPETQMNEETNAPACIYSAESGLLFFSPLDGNAAKVQELVKSMEHKGAAMQPVSGLGEEAYAATGTLPGAPNPNALMGGLVARKGSTIVAISLLSNLDAAKTTNALHQLAQASLARLP